MLDHLPPALVRQARQLGAAINALAATSPEQAGREAFRLFCTPRPMSGRRHALLDLAEQETVEVEQVAVRLYTWSAALRTAPVVLLLHGWESYSGRWAAIIGPLQKAGYTVAALDAPAHGQSGGRQLHLPMYSRIVAEVVKQRGQPYAMIGHSLGGAAAVMSMALFGAPAIQKAVLMATFAESARVLQDFARLLALEPPVVAAVRRELETQEKLKIEDFSIVGQAVRLIGVQGLVIHDRDDLVAPVAEGRAIAQAWGAEFMETQGLGHSLQGPVVVKAVLRFLGE